MLLAGLFTGTVVVCRHTKNLHDAITASRDIYYLPPSGWIRFFCAGYNEAAADLIWTKAVIYFSETSESYHRRSRAEKKKPATSDTVSYVETAIDLDPRFLKAYLYGAQFILFHQGLITEASVRKAIAVVERGTREFPDNGQLLFDLGFLHYWDLYNVLNNKEDKQAARRRGAHLIQKSSLMEDAPPYAANLSAGLLTEQGFTDLVIEHLQTQLFKETNPQTRHNLEVQLQKLQGKAAELDIARARQLYDRQQKKFSYIPFELFTLLTSEDAQLHPLRELYDIRLDEGPRKTDDTAETTDD